MNVAEIIGLLNQSANPAYLDGMKRFGIDNSKALGIPIPQLRKIAASCKNNHALALELWETGIHECRILASMIDDPAQVTTEQMDKWASAFYSWDLCDQVCGNLFDRTPYIAEKVITYTESEQEYIKRAGFVLMAEYAVHNKCAPDEIFTNWLPIIEREAMDDRNFVKKAINWALRQIGKRNNNLNALAIKAAEQILQQDNKPAKWITRNALIELKSGNPGK